MSCDTADCKRCAWCSNVKKSRSDCVIPSYRNVEVGEADDGLLSIGSWTNKRVTVTLLGCKYYARKPVLICPRLNLTCEWRTKKYDSKYDSINVCTRSVFDFCFCTETLPREEFDNAYGYKAYELVFVDREGENTNNLLQRLCMSKLAMSIPAYKGLVRY